MPAYTILTKRFGGTPLQIRARYIWANVFFIWFFQLADCFTTLCGIALGAKELNVLMAYFVVHPWLFFGLKSVFAFILSRSLLKYKDTTEFVWWCVAHHMIMGLVVLNNLFVIWRLS